MKKYTIMGIFAHPDDETFGPGGTFIKYAAEGHKVVVLTATSGQAGQAAGLKIEKTLSEVRRTETKNADTIMGLSEHHLLNFYDGTLNEAQIPVLQDFIVAAVSEIKPDIIIIFEPEGISLHLDHIAVSKAVILLNKEGRIRPKKIYYYGLPVAWMKELGRHGGLPEENQAIIDISAYVETKKKAMKAHVSQMHDVVRIMERMDMTGEGGRKYGNYEYFSLAATTLPDLKFPETDLLGGIK